MAEVLDGPAEQRLEEALEGEVRFTALIRPCDHYVIRSSGHRTDRVCTAGTAVGLGGHEIRIGCLVEGQRQASVRLIVTSDALDSR